MLKRMTICLALAGAPLTAVAQSVQDQVVTQLSDQGFTNIAVSRTLLGRLRFVAIREEFTRELVINPQTGEVLRDYWRDEDGDNNRVVIPGGDSSVDSGSGSSSGNDDGSTSGGSYDDHDEDDEDDDD